MSAQATQAQYRVTFFNALADRRGLLIDDIDEETAQAVVNRFSDKRDVNTYLPEVRIEFDDKATGSAS